MLTIGRAEACDVRVDVPGVDDEHAKISEVALIAVGPDCAVGDVPLDAGQRRLVIPGDEIQVGSVVLALDGQDPGVAAAEGGAHPGPRIRVVEGQNFGDELVLVAENREYVIGRSPKADLVLEDREVSREHIKIVRRGFNVFIFDAASTRGSWLGRAAVYQGSRVEWQRPRMLKLGATVLSLDLPAEVRARAPAVQVSAPMTPPPRVVRAVADKASSPAPPSGAAEQGLPANVGVYHYEAKPLPTAPSSTPPPADAAASHPAEVEAAPASLPPIAPSVPPVAGRTRTGVGGSRTAWKKTGPTIGRASGLLLLGLAGLAILGALFVVFSLME
ncbi:MAG: FHA domain-containing protein [Labilithrix sp.]|nr:FHA domain-containing protein [Labilithrix sp.]MBX3218331.1 FHA domain-containing protein [Labilithrix sp.]